VKKAARAIKSAQASEKVRVISGASRIDAKPDAKRSGQSESNEVATTPGALAAATPPAPKAAEAT